MSTIEPSAPVWLRRSASALSCAAVAFLASCGSGDSEVQRIPSPSLAFPLTGAGPAPMAAVLAYPNLTFSLPVYATHAPDNSDRIFVVQKRGQIRVFPNDPQVTAATTFLDISARVTGTANEEGLLGLAFDPDYANSGFFYVAYSAVTPRRSVIARYQVTANPNLADPNSEQILLEIPQPFAHHNAAMLEFGPDGMLYIGSGDGGGAGDPFDNAQNRQTLLGNILRIDPNGGAPYAIPAGNPFIGAGGGVREEIWAYGMRNPWRFSFDRQTGDLWVADVGQGAREELDIVVAGGNYGWPLYEGLTEYRNPNAVPANSTSLPLWDYDHGEGISVTGGYVYRGTQLPSLTGAYVYGDYGSGRVWALTLNQGQVVANTFIATVGRLCSFGEDQSGELLAGQPRRLPLPVRAVHGHAGALPAAPVRDRAVLRHRQSRACRGPAAIRHQYAAVVRQRAEAPLAGRAAGTDPVRSDGALGLPHRLGPRQALRARADARRSGHRLAAGDPRARARARWLGRLHVQVERAADGRRPDLRARDGHVHDHRPRGTRRPAAAGLDLPEPRRLPSPATMARPDSCWGRPPDS